MKYILLILVLLSIPVFSQDSLSLCNTLKKSYKVDYTGDTFTVDISPYTFMQIEDDIVYIEYNSIGTYVITATSFLGNCYKEDKHIVNIVECDSTLIWIPNAFTPNGDVRNPEFGAYGINVSEFKMIIWDRWGDEIFVSNNINYRWGGNHPLSGLPCQEDVYNYKVTYVDRQKKYKELFGRVTLIY